MKKYNLNRINLKTIWKEKFKIKNKHLLNKIVLILENLVSFK